MLYRRIQTRLIANASPDGVTALFEQMSGRRYRRLSLMGQAFAFREGMWITFLAVEAWLAYRLGGHHGTSPGNPFSIYTHWETPCLFASMLLAGGWIQPSPWPAWLRNTAKRGFLRDLYLSAMTPREIATSHFAARMLPTHANGWIFFTFFSGFIFGLDPRQGSMQDDMIEILTLAMAIISGMILKQANEYGLHARVLERNWGSLTIYLIGRGLVVICVLLLFVLLLLGETNTHHPSEMASTVLIIALLYSMLPIIGRTLFNYDLQAIEKQWEPMLLYRINMQNKRHEAS